MKQTEQKVVKIQEILDDDPEIARALDEVDRELIRAVLKKSPMERLRAASAHLKALRKFKHVPSQGS